MYRSFEPISELTSVLEQAVSRTIEVRMIRMAIYSRYLTFWNIMMYGFDGSCMGNRKQCMESDLGVMPVSVFLLRIPAVSPNQLSKRL